MDETASEYPPFSVIYRVIDGGPLVTFGWLSLLAVIIMGCILLIVAPRSGRGASLVDIFAACLHIQVLIFILCVPLALASAAYLTLSKKPYVEDMIFSAASVLINLSISGVLLVSVSMRHRTTPTIEWLPAVSVLASVISLFAVWQCRMAAFLWYDLPYATP